MPWRIVEVSITEIDEHTLTDDELTKLYCLVSHQTHNSYPEITTKIKPAAKHAKENIRSLHRWSDDGGPAHET